MKVVQCLIFVRLFKIPVSVIKGFDKEKKDHLVSGLKDMVRAMMNYNLRIGHCSA